MKNTILLVFVLSFGLVSEQTYADFTFGIPIQLGPNINSGSYEFSPSISGDGLNLYFSSNRHSGGLDFDIYISTRASKNEPWGQAVPIGPPVNTSATEVGPCISNDGLCLFFTESLKPFTATYRPMGYGNSDIWMATRATTDDPWGEPINAGPRVNTDADESSVGLSADGLSLFFSSDRPGGSGDIDLWVATRPTRNSEWGDPMNLGPIVNSAQSDGTPSLSKDGLHLFFHSNRPPSQAAHEVDLYLTSRRTITEDWGLPIRLGSPINTRQSWECSPCISPNGSTLYFVADNWSGTFNWYDIWYAPIIPIVDFNRDCIVDSTDMCILLDHWGQEYLPCDIGPTPLGDGIVDVQDLIVLAEHLFEEIFPPELVAYWKLDEAEGDIAYNSISDNYGVLNGNPTWNPASGHVAGALQFDGIDDYISTDFVLNPSDSTFSIFAWIKDGAAGQAILSQENGTNWLMADPIDGVLKTDLKEPASTGRDPQPPGPPLICSKVITDGDWHRVGFVRDGVNRILYVDDIEVTRDTASNLEAEGGGLYIGAGSSLELGIFFGLA